MTVKESILPGYGSIRHYSGVICVSLAWMCLLAVFQMGQSASKWYVYMNSKKKGSGHETKKMSVKEAHYGEESRMHPYRLTADRSVGNLLEWAWIFMMSLWLHAIFLDAEWAATLGWSYVAIRAFYPISFYKKMVYAVTALNYISLYLLIAPVAREVIFN